MAERKSLMARPKEEFKLRKGMFIHSRDLRKIGACGHQITKFRKEWPDGVKLLKKNLIRAAEIKLDLSWFAYAGLSRRQIEKYHKLTRDRYGRIIDIRTQYNAFHVPGLKKHARVIWEIIK
jgi:hypothetical protein